MENEYRNKFDELYSTIFSIKSQMEYIRREKKEITEKAFLDIKNDIIAKINEVISNG